MIEGIGNTLCAGVRCGLCASSVRQALRDTLSALGHLATVATNGTCVAARLLSQSASLSPKRPVSSQVKIGPSRSSRGTVQRAALGSAHARASRGPARAAPLFLMGWRGSAQGYAAR